MSEDKKRDEGKAPERDRDEDAPVSTEGPESAAGDDGSTNEAGQTIGTSTEIGVADAEDGPDEVKVITEVHPGIAN